MSMVSHTWWDQAPRAHSGYGAAAGSRSLDPLAERLYHMRIDRDGVWYHEGRPIARTSLVKLFASVLRQEQDGSYWLVTPIERGRIEVEDAPFVVVELVAEGVGSEQTIRVRSNLDEWVTVGPDHPLRLRRPPDETSGTGPVAPVPYVDIRPGLAGRLLRSVYYELVDLGDEYRQNNITRYGVWSAGRFFALDQPSP